MVTFLLLGFFVILGIGLAIVAYSSNNRARAGMKGTPTQPPAGTTGNTANVRR